MQPAKWCISSTLLTRYEGELRGVLHPWWAAEPTAANGAGT